MGSTLSNLEVNTHKLQSYIQYKIMISIFNNMNRPRRSYGFMPLMERDFFSPSFKELDQFMSEGFHSMDKIMPGMDKIMPGGFGFFENGVMKLNLGDKPENLKVQIKDGQIKIESKVEKENGNEKSFSSFQTIRSLPKYVVDQKLENKVECSFKDGNLFVKLPENKMIENVPVEIVVDTEDKEL